MDENLAGLVWVAQELYGSICVGLKTKKRSDLNVVRLRRTQLSHTIKTSIILSQVFCS